MKILGVEIRWSVRCPATQGDLEHLEKKIMATVNEQLDGVLKQLTDMKSVVADQAVKLAAVSTKEDAIAGLVDDLKKQIAALPPTVDTTKIDAISAALTDALAAEATNTAAIQSAIDKADAIVNPPTPVPPPAV